MFGNLGFKYGVTGVDIFFLFSGFVVLMSFKDTATLRQLIVNRIARLYPAYWAAVFFTGFLFWFYNVHTKAELVLFAKMIANCITKTIAFLPSILAKVMLIGYNILD